MKPLAEQVSEVLKVITHWPTCVMNFSAVQGPCICRIEERRAAVVVRAMERGMNTAALAAQEGAGTTLAVAEGTSAFLAALKEAP